MENQVSDRSKSFQFLCAVALVCVTAIGCVWLHSQTTRFQMVPVGNGAYKFDRASGQVWFVNGSRYEEVTEPTHFSH